MKKILTFIICLFAYFVCEAQYTIPQNLGGPTTLVKTPNYGGLQGGLIPFTFTDTSNANSLATYLRQYNGALIWTTTPPALWYRAYSLNKWVQLIPGADTSSVAAWSTRLNTNIPTDASLVGFFGTTAANGIGFYTNNTQRLILPASGLTFNQSISDTTLNKVLTYNTSTKAIGYAYWYGGGSGSTPTWQQTLTAGSTLSSSNTIVSGANTQTFTFNTLNGTGFSISSSSTVGGLVVPQKLFSSVYTGAHATNGVTSYSGFFSNQQTGTSSRSIGVWAQAFGATENIGLLVDRGSIDIGLTGFETGILNMYGSTSGKITFQSQAAAGTYNWNWPTTAGTSGYLLTSAGGGSSPMTWTDPSTLGGTLTSTYIGYGSGSNTLTGNANLTFTAASNSVVLDSGYLSFTGHKDYGSAVNGSIFKSSLYGLTMRAISGASYDWLLFNAGGSAVLANPTGTTTFGTSGNFGVSLLGSTISARLHIAAGSATAGTAPLKFNSGTNLTSPEAGAMEWDGTNLFVTQTTGPTRRTIAYTSDLTGLPYWPLSGSAGLTSSVTVDLSSNDFTITNGGAGSNMLLTSSPGQVFITLDGANKKLFLYSQAIGGSSAGDALTVADPLTGELTVAPNLAFNLKKEGTMIYANNGRIFAEDNSGNKTQISPHNEKGEWIYKSTDKSGITTEINMIHLAELLEKVTGEKLIYKTKN